MLDWVLLTSSTGVIGCPGLGLQGIKLCIEPLPLWGTLVFADLWIGFDNPWGCTPQQGSHRTHETVAVEQRAQFIY